MAPHAIDSTLGMLQGTSESAKLFGQSNIASKDQLVAQGQVQTAQGYNGLLQQHNDELMQSLGNSTLQQKGDPSSQIIKTLPAREIVLTPTMDDGDGIDRLSESWWTRYPAPVPRFEKFSNNPSIGAGKLISAKDVKGLEPVPGFHVKFDPAFGYRNFLS